MPISDEESPLEEQLGMCKYKLDEHGQKPPLGCAVDGCEALHPNAFIDDRQLYGWRCSEHNPTDIAMRHFDEIYKNVFESTPNLDRSEFVEFRKAAVRTASSICPNITNPTYVISFCANAVRMWLKMENDILSYRAKG